MTLRLAPLAALSLLAFTPACAQQDDAAPQSRDEIEEIVRDYILEHPEVIEQALIKLQQRASEQEAQSARDAIASNEEAIYESDADYSIGPDDAPVTLVEFFDYRCGFCKRSMEWTMELPDAYDGQVRVVFKEFPILSPESEKAALAALAAGEQGRYSEMHRELMELDNSSGFTPDEIDAAAERAGVDVDRMRADMGSVRLQKVVADNKTLARQIGINGTPAFLVGDEMVSGANQPGVIKMLDEAVEQAG